ncbi:GlxA family transcriptional regulator [Shewanella salipaludis]|uniref:Helix-turn-helix domain-containing protein n=1 Tax=Shewanella salipaludis TaxID=2723052 RepID=A0A972G1K6_9GAMM|nr:helix-turn-helix domain-containing protein [Shewanella salipaludis]NMH65504.1 helix-turn-helix domain-containing protein [Shewanella salipaludis]
MRRETEAKREMKIGLLIYPGCVASGLLAFAELLTVANHRAGRKHFTLCWVGDHADLAALAPASQSTIPLGLGFGPSLFSLPVDRSLASMATEKEGVDALLVPGFWASSTREVSAAIRGHRQLIQGLKQLPATTQLLAYCSGVCLLAETGKLDNRVATSTWWLADYLGVRFPGVQWHFSQTCLYRPGYASASGVNGYLPLAQALIGQQCGQDVLRDIIELMILPKPEPRSQPLAFMKLVSIEDKLIRSLILWVEQTQASQLNLSALAQALNTTERTLSRKVKDLTGHSCAQFMRLVKLHQASERLIYSRQSIAAIGEELGFSDDTAFRRSFKQVCGFTPNDYRNEFKRT